MKKLSVVCAAAIVLAFMTGSAFAISYCQDFLEPGNPGGRTTGLKTCDTVNPVTVNPGDQFSIDIWVSDLPESIIASGFQMTYNPTQVSIVSVQAYDNVDIAGGPWDGSGTIKIPDAVGPGSYILGLVQLSCAVPDAGGDVIVAKVTFQCLSGGSGAITIKSIDGFDTTVGCASGVNYDPQLGTNTITINQGPSGPVCGDGTCNGTETCKTCPQDCGVCPPQCGDGSCNGTETCGTCSQDCGVCPSECGNGTINAGEDCDPPGGCCASDCTWEPAGTPCPDTSYCNGIETCNAVGVCQPGTPPFCSDGVDCTVDSCNDASGICVHTPNDGNCADDGLFCNGVEVCDPINDCVSTGDPCPAGFACQEDTDLCEPVSGITVNVDIKPGSCPNPLNVKSRGVLPVAILGKMNFNVTSIDPTSIKLSREGLPAQVAPLRWSQEDVGTPFAGELCDCHELNSDGYMDLTLKFKTQELVKMLKLYEVSSQTIPLTLTGNLMDGTEITGKDCIRVQGCCKGDFDSDGDVDGKDSHKIKVNFGWRGSVDSENGAGDFDDDGDIDATDINGFLSVYGTKYVGPCGFIECNGDFDCDSDVDGKDTMRFKTNFGRTIFNNPCTDANPCIGDFDGDRDCDGSDATSFKADFGRSPYKNPCRGCVEQ